MVANVTQMKILLISRHAEAGWVPLGATDFDRHILPQGEQNTLQICAKLKQENIAPDYILTSAAVRTKETTALIANEFNVAEDKIYEDKKFYSEASDIWIDEISFVEDNVQTLMLVGHNPTVTYLAKLLLPNDKILELPTSSVVCIQFDCDKWTEISPKNSKLLHFFKQQVSF